MTSFRFAPSPTGARGLRSGIAWLFFVAFVFGLLSGSPAWGQKKDYEEWREQQRQKYQEYLNEQDKAFLKFLKKQWRNVDVEAQRGSPVDDKPEEIPTVGEPGTNDTSAPSSDAKQVPSEPEEPSPQSDARPADPPVEEDAQPGEPPQTPDPDAAEENLAEEDPEPVEEDPDPSEEDPDPSPDNPFGDQRAQEGGGEAATATMSLQFFGAATSVPYDASLAPALDGAPGKESIRTYWRSMAGQEYAPTLDAVQARRDDLGLSDWGYYVYLRDLGSRFYEKKGVGENENAATLWTWFMLMKSGYAARVGYQGDTVFLMLPVDGQIYNRPQMYLDDQKYYLMVEDTGGGSLRTYEGQHGEARQVLSLDEGAPPRFEGATKRDTASFSHGDERFNLEYEYDTAVLDYLRAYPNVELRVLFEAGASSAAESSLTDALQPHLRDRSPRDALNFLLSFVQFATKYERDRENFGEERFLFPEESLAARASDCEDRAVLFAYLARTLLDRDLVGLEWPSHVATAVRVGDGLEATAEDRTLTVDGETYVMADPTYIGSDLGMEMPFVEGKEPDVIPVAE